MSVGVLLDVGKSLTSVRSTITSIDLDVTLDELHEWTNEVTTNPVEFGSPITDHIQLMPDKLTITGTISNSGISESSMAALSNGDDLVQTAFDALLKIKEDRTLVTVYTRYRYYTDMALQSVNIPRSAGIGDSVQFKMEFIKIRIVNTQIVNVPAGISRKLDKKSGTATQRKAQPQTNNGKKQTETPKIQSVLSGILSKLQ